jgi:hypothetical protein
VEGNPVNLTDSSGNCPEAKNEADACWQLLLKIETGYDFIDLQTDLSKDSYWTLDGLLIFEEALWRYDLASGIGLSTLYPTDIRIKRERTNEYKDKNVGVCGRTYRYLSGPIRLYNGFDVGCIIHELAHYLDFHIKPLSKSFETYVGASTFLWWYNVGPESPPYYPPGNPTNRREDFAESLSEYVLLYTNISSGQIRIIPGEKRWQFIESVLDTVQAPITIQSSECVPSLGILNETGAY